MGCSGAKALETLNEQKNNNKNSNNDNNNDNDKNNNNDNNKEEFNENNKNQNYQNSEIGEILSLNNNLNITETESTILGNNHNKINNQNNIQEDENYNENNFLNTSNSDNNTLISSVNNSFYNNETTTENLNEMFNIKKEFSNSNMTILNLTIYANRFEAMYPIWIEKNTEIKFNVNGKWKVDSKNECTSIGIENNEINTNNLNNEDNFNNGALIGRIFNDKPFVIYDNLIIKSKISGPLFLRMNIKNLFNKILPSGKLNVKIFGAKNVNSFEEIDEMLGWDKNLKEIEYNDNDKNFFIKLSFIDRETIIYLNKARFNSNLYSIQYLDNIKNLNSSTKILYDFMINQKKKIEKFKVNDVVMKLIEIFYKPFYGRGNKLKNKQISILNSQKEFENYLNDNFENKKKFKVFIIKHDCQKPLSLSIKLLINEKIRKEIFNEENKEITLLTIRTRKRQKINYFSFLIFSNEDGNKGINNLKKLLFYNPSYSNMNKPKTNLEIINEEKVKNNITKSINKKIKIIRGLNIDPLKEKTQNLNNSTNLNFNQIEKDEIDKTIYKSDDENNFHKNENDKNDDDEDDDE